jgi:hypothetical protein
MNGAIVIRPRPVFFRTACRDWELRAAWNSFRPDEIEHGFADYLQRLRGWRHHYSASQELSWPIVDVHLPPYADSGTLADILETLQAVAQHDWRWSWPNQLPNSLLLPLHIKRKKDAILVKLKHG